MEEIKTKKELFDYFNKKQLLELKEDHPFERRFTVEEIEEEEQVKKILLRVYEDIQFILNKYLDMNQKHTKLISLWIMGTYWHPQFNSYPYLYLNAMRGSGKTRLLNLIAAMSKDGEVQNSLTEAVLFRTKGTLCIDEFEKGGRKGSENLLELLNSAYKKGTMVKRMKKKKTPEGEDQVVEKFDVYRPIALANITGLDNVLQDRCIKIVMEKSVNEKKTRLIENLLEARINEIKQVLGMISSIQCSLCSVVCPENLYQTWNNYILEQDTTLTYTTTFTTLHTLSTLKQRFDSIKKTSINGRDLELSLPLIIISLWIDWTEDLEMKSIFEENLAILDEISLQKKQEESIENVDISLIDFIATEPQSEYFIPLATVTQKFKEYLQTNEEWLNNIWMGRALSRLSLIKQKRRLSRGIEVQLNTEKAQEKIGQLK